MSDRLSGKVIVITGATQGIGKGIARMCANEGAQITINGLSEADGEQVVQEIKNRYGVDSIFVGGDIRQVHVCKQIMGRTIAAFGKIDGLVNNAGVFPRGTLLDTNEQVFGDVFDVNIKGAFFCSQYAVESMLRTGGGSIVHIGSINAYKGKKYLAAYSCSKGALLTLNQHIAANYREEQIRSNWITVGWVATEGEIDMVRKSGGQIEGLLNSENKRLQTVKDIAYGAVYLLSDESKRVTGTELAINGGNG